MEMDLHSGGAGPVSGGILGSGSNVPAFLTKLWTLVEDPDTDPLICWSPSGNSFHVYDQGHFAKEVLPKYFKHNNMASFVRQLNMYGFRKVVHIEQGGLVKPEKDDTEFQHAYFIRGQEHLLENIKRKVTNVRNSYSIIKHDDIKIRQDDVSKLLTDVQIMRGKQENMDSKLIAMKHENEALWREVASLRQKHAQQQKVVNKLIQFLISLVQSNRVLGMKRKIPLMLNDSSTAHSIPKYSRQYSLEPLQGSPAFSPTSQSYTGANLFSSDSTVNCGPIISDITDLPQLSPSASPNDQTEENSTSPSALIKEEPQSPEEVQSMVVNEAPLGSVVNEAPLGSVVNEAPLGSVVNEAPLGSVVNEAPLGTVVNETPLSPTTFIDSLLEDSEAGAASAGSSTAQSQDGEKCLSLACVENLSRSPQMSEVTCVFTSPSSSSLHSRPEQGNDLSEHLETIDSNLENLQTILTGQSIGFDSSPLFDLFASSLSSTDFNLPDLDTSLASIQDLLAGDQKPTDTTANSADTGKQLVQYTAQPLFMLDPSNADEGSTDLPNLFELDDDNSYFGPGDDCEDPTISLLSNTTYHSKTRDP
ncbi:heat shock factor protein 1 isoform X1 [Acipenser oxyrinchus oxyrinchus]|uniref:Heat shock factor protein 1 isoform X1 n=1 Tax=Acipenser oxyrinchus oxyrinchus TaxID=40147 RepID=A0AAD8GF12_ACIOX|nr:heat shock factor protein 1 isoform X1 [Acipenser oxyrinchus oxyrinchus]